MDSSLISTGLATVFLFFVILGFTFGWFRGLNKSLLRFIMVVAVGVLAFFVIPPITTAILNLDISKFGIVIGEIEVVTVQDLLTDLLRNIPGLEEIIEDLFSSQTLESFIQLVPQMLVNVILFVVLFFAFKWLSMVIYWIISAIFFSKKKMEGKDKHSFIGALIGAIQGFVVACLIFVPVFGLHETLKPVAEATVSQQEVQAVQSEGNKEDDGLTQTIEQVTPVLTEIENNWVFKMLSSIGVKDLSVTMFDELTTVKDKNIEFTLRREVSTIADALPYVNTIQETNFNLEDNDTLRALKNAVDKLYNSPVFSGVIDELIPAMARAWSVDGGKFCGISKPQFEDAELNVLLTDVLDSIVESSTIDVSVVKTDLDTCIDVLMFCNDTGLLETIKAENPDFMAMLNKEGNENFVGDLIDVTTQSSTLKIILPSMINYAMGFVYDMLDVTGVEDISSAIRLTDQEWEEEKQTLQAVFTNLRDIYNEINAEGVEDKLEQIDFEKLGLMFDNLRNSHLLATPSKALMQGLLKSEAIVGSTDTTTLTEFSNILADLWEDSTKSLTSTFKALGEAIDIAKALSVNVEDFDVSNLSEVLTTLKDQGLTEVVNNIVSEEQLANFGVGEDTAAIINETVLDVLNTEDEELFTKNAEALEQVLVVANQIVVEQEAVEIANAGALINALADSSLLTTISAETSKVSSNLNLKENISNLSDIENEINKLDATQYAEQIAALNALFGTSATGSSVGQE